MVTDSRVSLKHNVLMRTPSFRRIDDRLLDEETSATPEGYATPVEETKSVDAATSDAAAGILPRI